MKWFLQFAIKGKGLRTPAQTKHRRIPKAIGSSWQMQLRRNKSERIRKRLKTLNARLKRVRMETNEIQKEQKVKKMGQQETRKKFEVIQYECKKLGEETKIIIKQSINTQLRLALMFAILKARESNDFSKAANLTQLLREMVAMQNNGRL